MTKAKGLLILTLIPIFMLVGELRAFGIGAWGGYNIPTEKFDCSTYSTNGGSCTVGGISFGMDVWAFSLGPLSLGISGGYLSLLDYDQSYTSSGSRVMNQGNASLIPITASAEVQFLGIIGGVGFGPAFYSQQTKIDNVAIQTDTTISETLMAIEFHAGYGFGLGPVTIAPEARFYYTLAKDISGGKINDNLNFVPSLLVSFKF